MSVIIGSARSDERNGARGGAAGDQKNGKEVSTQNWYLNSKGWRVFRCIDPDKAAQIGWCMSVACANDNVGYDQGQRNTLYTEAQKYGFDVRKITKPVETDCSALVRVCCAYAGIMLANFYTTTEPARLLGSGMFVELTGDKYTKKQDYLRVGDILVTPVQGHTVVVITNGAKYEPNVPTPYKGLELGDRLLTNGCTGTDVIELQEALIKLGYSVGDTGADGDFGDNTEMAVKLMQIAAGITVDGEFGQDSYKALNMLLDKHDAPVAVERFVQIINGNCYVRSAPNTKGKILGVATKGTKLPYGGQDSDDGWKLVAYNDQNGWVSGKYSRMTDNVG